MAINRLPPYKHFSLDHQRNIRVLHVLPGRRSDDLTCKLEQRSPNAQDPYEALSYVWGDETQRGDIICDGKRFNITRSLFDALQAIRHVDRIRVLWIDAVCINQEDHVEKTAQLKMMGEIYRQAQAVAAWIGHEENQDRAAMDMDKYIDLPPLQALSISEMRTWFALTAFIRRPWFSRVWIVQEVALARDLTMHYGTYQIKWTILRQALLKFLKRFGLYLKTAIADVSFERVFTLLGIRNLVTENTWDEEDSQNVVGQFHFNRIDEDRMSQHVQEGDFLEFIKATRQFGSTNKSDRVFAMMGLVLPEERSLIEINSNAPFTEVYRHFTQALLKRTNELGVLSQAGMNPRTPSWIPDWSQSLETSPLKLARYGASGDSDAGLNSERIFESSLLLRATIIDQIDILLPGLSYSESGDSEFEGVILKVAKLILPLAALKDFVNPLKVFQAIPVSNSATKEQQRITPELETQWHNLAQSCAPHSADRDAEEAYLQTLTGCLPLAQLRCASSSVLPACLQIWRDRLSKDPVMDRGFTQPSTMFQGFSTKVPTELLALYYMEHDPASIKEKRKNESQGKIQVNSSEKHPVYMSGTGVDTYVAVKKALSKKIEDPQEQQGQQGRTWEEAMKYATFKINQWNDRQDVKIFVARMFSRIVERLARNRQFCKTEGQRLGWVPREAKRGDVICLLHGARVPFVLRPAGGETGGFRIIGEACIQGVMHGEALLMPGLRTQDIRVI